MEQGMTDVQLNQYLETIAKLIEAEVQNPEARAMAAKIVRDGKV